ncbi:polyhydroxyalkanoic acid system family protein [Caenibius sp. WL]|uniref:polyhydroxyalkanoic acid system family protein n=1 Tax=Caenibius sp. WL TaxID=2872646 RepID=UPI001C99F2C2|nr:polyhydroxyalkanoic acid system family protein [Caenibius sp. WL]QZP08360.1 polyhydroxyalkanoic acid system family protein [Caenibius sp. WL]
MRVTVPHELTREEVRKRLHERAQDLAGNVPGGMAEVTTNWVSDDQVDLTIAAMGQNLTGNIVIEDGQVVIDLALPLALTFVEPMIAGTVKEQGQKLLA